MHQQLYVWQWQSLLIGKLDNELGIVFWWLYIKRCISDLLLQQCKILNVTNKSITKSKYSNGNLY